LLNAQWDVMEWSLSAHTLTIRGTTATLRVAETEVVVWDHGIGRDPEAWARPCWSIQGHGPLRDVRVRGR